VGVALVLFGKVTAGALVMEPVLWRLTPDGAGTVCPKANPAGRAKAASKADQWFLNEVVFMR
jgi:hypothetical protein